jgi:hypothetical protein
MNIFAALSSDKLRISRERYIVNHIRKPSHFGGANVNPRRLMAEDDKVGYGRPPKHSQFPKGHSGNPSGRPKTVPSLRSDLADELQQLHEIFENGTPKTVTKQRAIIKSLTAAAIDNDMRAVTALLSMIRQYDVGTDEPPSEVDIEDLDQLEAYVSNERKRLSPSSLSAGPSSDQDAKK